MRHASLCGFSNGVVFGISIPALGLHHRVATRVDRQRSGCRTLRFICACIGLGLNGQGRVPGTSAPEETRHPQGKFLARPWLEVHFLERLIDWTLFPLKLVFWGRGKKGSGCRRGQRTQRPARGKDPALGAGKRPSALLSAILSSGSAPPWFVLRACRSALVALRQPN
jgi:hypothetical protein